MGGAQAAIERITGEAGLYSTFADEGTSLECDSY